MVLFLRRHKSPSLTELAAVFSFIIFVGSHDVFRALSLAFLADVSLGGDLNIIYILFYLTVTNIFKK